MALQKVVIMETANAVAEKVTEGIEAATQDLKEEAKAEISENVAHSEIETVKKEEDSETEPAEKAEILEEEMTEEDSETKNNSRANEEADSEKIHITSESLLKKESTE